MPDVSKVIYWWGYKGSGFANPGKWPSQTAITMTEYTNYCQNNSSAKSTIGKDNIVSSDISTAYCIMEGSNTADAACTLFLIGNTYKNANITTANVLNKVSRSYESSLGTPVSVSAGANSGNTCKVYALWYE